MFGLSHRQGRQPARSCLINFFVAALRCSGIFMVFISLFVTGCTAVQQGPLFGDTYRTLPDKYQKKALAYEGRGQLREAVQSWQIVLSFQPGNVEIKERIVTLRKKAMVKADSHFKKGINFYRRGRIRDARREFLLALAYDQDHVLALEYLKTKLQRSVFKTYSVQSGDTVKKIAVKEFGDPKKYILITSFNDVDSSRELSAGTLLQIPVLGTDFLVKKESTQNIAKYDAIPTGPSRSKNNLATTTSSKNVSQEVVRSTDEKQSETTGDLANYLQAKKFLERGEYEKAYKLLLSLNIDFRDVRQLKASTEVFLQQEADAHYRKGISYFLSENLDKAIEEWEEVLRLRPNHLKAQKDLKNARKMQERVEGY